MGKIIHTSIFYTDNRLDISSGKRTENYYPTLQLLLNYVERFISVFEVSVLVLQPAAFMVWFEIHQYFFPC